MSARRPTDLPRPAFSGVAEPYAGIGDGIERDHDGHSDGGDEAAAQLLNAIRDPLRAQMSLFAWRGFLEPLMPGGLVEQHDGTLVLTVFAPSTFLADWVRDHYGPALTTAVGGALGRAPSTCRVQLIARPMSTVPQQALPTASTWPMPADQLPPEQHPAHPAQPSSSSLSATLLPQPAPASVTLLPQASMLPQRAPTPSTRHGERHGEVVAMPTPQRRAPGRRLDPRYTFDSFVTGPGTRMAFSASSSVAERPGARYSPLFLFGPTGLGKTHLLHAVGHEILARHPQQRVALLSAEQWVNEFISDAHDKKFDAFRKRFRDDIDVLLIDDIQFLAGKAQSQDEFFHTFNALYESHKQIVVTSDRYPHEIAGLEERLKTRFQWGLVCDVQPPDADTRRAILSRKAVDLGCALPTEVLDFVAASVTTSVRALEGALTRLVAWSQLTREPITLDEARTQLRPTLQAGAASPLSVGRIIEVVATYHGMRGKDLMGPSRQRQVTRARHIAMFLARQHLQMSLPELGRAFGGRDHTTVLASVSKIESTRHEDASLQALLGRLEQTLF
jgi:chromosomal replication initiator protein